MLIHDLVLQESHARLYGSGSGIGIGIGGGSIGGDGGLPGDGGAMDATDGSGRHMHEFVDCAHVGGCGSGSGSGSAAEQCHRQHAATDTSYYYGVVVSQPLLTVV